MVEMTVSRLREKINNKLESARLQVQKLEEQLRLIDTVIQEEEKELEITPEPTDNIRKLIVKPFFQVGELAEEDTIGRVITETIRNIDRDTKFSVKTVVGMVQAKFPDIPYSELSKRASAKTYRLEKRKEIEIVKRGHGRNPHIYKRIK